MTEIKRGRGIGQHGGARPGTGPKRKPPEQQRRLVAARLTEAQIRAAERLGDGNVSAGIGAALERAWSGL